MKSDSIIDSGLHISLDLDISLKANSFFQTNLVNRAHLANQLLLYDKIIIPTKDFGIVPILINWLGMKTFNKALYSGTFSFLRTKFLLGYQGKGVGLTGFFISPGEKEWRWWQEAIFGKIDASIEQQLRNMCPFIDRKERKYITDKIISVSKEIEHDSSFFEKNIINETYVDISNNKSLSMSILQSNKKILDKNDLKRLEGVKINEIRVLNLGKAIEDSIDLVLRISEINMEIFMSTLSDNADLFTSEGAELLLKDKLIRSGIGSTYLDGFLYLLELNNIPDIGKAIYTDSLSLPDIWEIREGENSKEFRKWLRKATTKDAKEIVKLYIESLKNKTLINSLPLKILRFAITSLVGAINPPIGLSVSAIDSFFVEKWLSGFSPRLFLDELSKINIDLAK
jgi:hypothetical protein